jgi:hypothetical protein
MGLFMAAGDYAASKEPFPKHFAPAMDAENAAAK